MIDQPSSFCLLSTLLSDNKGTPVALLLGFRDVAAADVLALAAHDEFKALTARLPCLIRAGDPVLADPEVAGALEATPCRMVADGQIFHTEQALEQSLPPGAEWVSGTWYMAPPLKASDAQAASRALALQMVQLVLADADTHEIEALFRRDPALSYHLLRLVNSLGVGAGKKIASFAQAIVILGRQQLRRWLNLMLFSAREGDPRSAMLLARVAMRARLMELLAKECGLDRSTQELAFMAGMFSLLGVLFGQPLVDVLKPLTISETLRGAVLEYEGDLGHLLELIDTFENGKFDSFDALLDAIQVPHTTFNFMRIESVNWMLNMVRESQGSANA